MSLFANGVTELLRFADYRGRSTRTDLGAFWLVTMSGALILTVAATILEAAIRPALPLTTSAQIVYEWILTIPMFALLVRRLHDRGISGWCAGLCVPMALQNIIADFYRLTGDIEAMLAVKGSTSYLIAGFPLLVAFIFLLAPGEEGPNAYGPNPRYDPPGEAAGKIAGLPPADGVT
jgi:uncharacterized membrane protein YhaH (DUF805 family)